MGYTGNNDESKSGVVELNLVPFIDLMSVCIIFLLITAVWVQISMIQLGTSIYAKKVSDTPPAELTPDIQIPFRVDVLSTGYRVLIGSRRFSVPVKSNQSYDHVRFREQLKIIRQKYPQKIDVVVTSQDQMIYKHVIMAMDLLLSEGFSGISIATGEVL